MKRIVLAVSVGILLTASQTKAGQGYNPNFRPGCVSSAPVGCATPVAYYQAPVCVSPQPDYNYNYYSRYNPSVIHIGGGRYNYSSTWNSSCGTGTQVIRFGHVQAYRQGYQFRGWR